MILSYILAGFAILGGIDYFLGNKFGIGKEFERGIMLLGTMMLTMVGMIVISPLLAELMKPVTDAMNGMLDPSLLPAVILANDMGGAHLAVSVAGSELVGVYHALIVAAMMGATISFTIPFALGAVKERKREMLLGLLCGIVTIPVGAFLGGLILGIPFLVLLVNLLPLAAISAVIAFGVLKFPDACVRIFGAFGILIKAVVVFGLVVGIFEFLTKIDIIPHTYDIGVGGDIIVNAACTMAGAFPLVAIITRLLKRPLTKLGPKLGMNEKSVVGFLSTVAASAITFGVMDDMDEKGAMLNSAFAVSAAWTIAGHLAFTMAFTEEQGITIPTLLPAYFVAKLTAGVLAVALAVLIYRILGKRKSEKQVLEG